MQDEAAVWPGRKDARALQFVLVIAGFAGLVAGASLTGPMFIWLSLLRRTPNTAPFPVVSLLGLALPLVSIGLGTWAWRGRRVRKLVALYPILGGALGLGLGLALGAVVVAISLLV